MEIFVGTGGRGFDKGKCTRGFPGISRHPPVAHFCASEGITVTRVNK